MNIDFLTIEPLMQVILASLIGGLVGAEREWSGKAAGLRTQLLVCVGAAVFTILSGRAAEGFEFADPARISAQIVSGLGFLGGAVVLKSRGDVKGVTTAATIWTVASLGVAIGMSEYVLAGAGTLVVLFTLGVLGRYEQAASWNGSETTIRVHLAEEGVLESVAACLDQHAPSWKLLGVKQASSGQWIATVNTGRSSAEVVGRRSPVRKIQGVEAIEWGL